MRLVFSLAIVVGLLLLLARLGGRRFKGQEGAPVRVLHRQALSRNASVVVVSVGTRVLVLGTTEQQVQVLTELAPDELEVPQPLPQQSSPFGSGAHRTKPGATVRTASADGWLAGSVLSARTWRQARAATTRRAS